MRELQNLFVQGLGADEVVDYSTEDFSEKYKAQPFDAVLDVIGGETEVKSYDILKKSGIYAHIKYVTIPTCHRSCQTLDDQSNSVNY